MKNLLLEGMYKFVSLSICFFVCLFEIKNVNDINTLLLHTCSLTGSEIKVHLTPNAISTKM